MHSHAFKKTGALNFGLLETQTLPFYFLQETKTPKSLTKRDYVLLENRKKMRKFLEKLRKEALILEM